MELPPGLYSDRRYETPEDPQQNGSRKRRVLLPSVPNPSPVTDEGNTAHPYSSQRAWAPEVNRYVDALEQEVSPLEPEAGANVGGRRQSRNASSRAQEPDGDNREYGDPEEPWEYRQRDPNLWRVNNNPESPGQTSSNLNVDTRTLADHILRQYPAWMNQADVEKEYKATDTMIEVFRNDQRARRPMVNDSRGITEMSKEAYENLLSAWHDANPLPNMSSLIEAYTARNLNEDVGQLENNPSRPRVRAERAVDPQITRQTSAPNVVRSTGALIRSAAPLAQPPTVPANYRSQRPYLGHFVSTGSYTSTAEAAGSEGRSEIVRLATAYQFLRRHEPVSGPQPQAERIVSGNTEGFRHDPTAARRRVIQPYIFNHMPSSFRSRDPSSRQQATAQEAVEHVAFPVPGRLQLASRDVRSVRVRPSEVVDHEDGELPDSQ
ncbi:hypothetical protein DFP73DRAFT_592039 [Morchella snyderi]|nr:hypothetical protein DFP73DRAFT_592039 [Morchella snyderi]